MTSNKILEILAFIEALYPNNRTDEQKKIVANFWNETFEEYDDYIVEMAVKHCIKKNSFEPKIADILSTIKALYRIQNPIFPEYTYVWNSVVEAITPRRKTHAQAFEELPQVAKEIIHDPKRLYEYGQMSPELVLTKVESSFRKSFNEKLNAAEKKDELSDLLKQTLIQDFINKPKLIG